MPNGNKKSRREKKAPGLPLSPAYAATDLPDTAGLPLVSSSVRGNECSNCFELFSRATTTCERYHFRGMCRIILGGLGNASRIFHRAYASPEMQWLDTHSHPKDFCGVASIEKASCTASRCADYTPRHTTPLGWGYCAVPAKRGAGGWQDAAAGAGLSETHAAGESLPAWELTHDTHQVTGGD